MVGASIAVDTDGYPFVIYTNKTPGYDYNNYITKSSANNGTWVTAGGYPLTLTSNNGKEGVAIVSYLDSNKIYALYTIVDTLYGRYYNGSSWQTAETLASGSSYVYYNGVSDEDDNVYIVWEDGITCELFFKIRYADGSFGVTTQIIDATDRTYPSVAYNDNNGYIYIVYMRDGSVRCVTLAADTFTGEYTLFNPTGPYHMAGVTPYGDHIGLLYTTSSGGDTEHGFIQFPWEWDDNGNNWTWMQNNVMPYADNLVIAVDGTIHLEYEPSTIIQGTTLPDISEASDNDGIITWGENPDGVTCEMGGFVEEGDGGIPSGNYTSSPGWTDPMDMIGPTGQPGWTAGLPTLEDNPLYPLMKVTADQTKIPLGIIWILFASFWVMAAMLLSMKYMPHQLFTALIGGGTAAFFVLMGIYPFWVIFIFAAMALAIIVGERTPTVG